MLGALGMSDREDKVYRYLIDAMPATVDDLLRGTGLRPAQVDDALSRLEELGLAHRVDGDPVRFAAASPSTIDTLIAGKLADLRQAQFQMDQLAARYRARHLEADGAGIFEVIRGAEALRERTFEMARSARSEALNMVKPPIVAMRTTEGVEPPVGVRARLVYDREAVADAATLQTVLAKAPGTHCELRVHTKLPVKMMAIDREMALVPLTQADSPPAGVMITQSAVLDSLLALFDYVWNTAVSLHVPNPGSDGKAAGNGKDAAAASAAARATITPADQQLLSLLLAGLTDQAIASHLDVSVRTVERRVRALMDAAHVSTRLQLTWEAGRQQWLLDSRPPQVAARPRPCRNGGPVPAGPRYLNSAVSRCLRSS